MEKAEDGFNIRNRRHHRTRGGDRLNITQSLSRVRHDGGCAGRWSRRRGRLVQTVTLMVTGAQGITNAVLRILAAGVLAGVLIESGAANTIAETVVKKVGESRALLALAIATMILTAVGVFIDVAVITVAPIALSIARRAGLSKLAILLAMIGGGKAGNVMSPNPNAIAASDSFHVPLTSVMMGGIIPGLFGTAIAYFLAKRLSQKGSMVTTEEIISQDTHGTQPGFLAAISAPLLPLFC